MRVAVFGMGYVGCVTGACLARDGHVVIGVDVDPHKVAEINAGQAPVAEPGLAELITSQVNAARLRATTDAVAALAVSDLALVAVGTPSDDDGAVSSAGVERVLADIGVALRPVARPFTIVVRSTLLPGILEDRLAPILAASAGRPLGAELRLCNNPEFLREASAIRDYDAPPFVVVGATESAAAEDVLALYATIPGERIVVDTRTAALVKYASNAFHALKVAFANEVGSVSRALGADGHAVMDLVCRDRKLNIAPAYLRPGFAFGGSCLPKDLRALTRFAEREALRLPLLSAILPSNDAHLQRALKRIRATGRRRIGLIGLGFKAGTDDLRESPLVALVETLIGWGRAVRVFDPNVQVSRLRGRNLAYVDVHLPHLAALLVDEPTELLTHAELLVLGTDVAEGVDWCERFTGPIFDLRRELAK